MITFSKHLEIFYLSKNQMTELSHLLAHSPDAHNSRGRAMSEEPRTQPGSPVQKAETPPEPALLPPRCAVAGSWLRSRGRTHMQVLQERTQASQTVPQSPHPNVILWWTFPRTCFCVWDSENSKASLCQETISARNLNSVILSLCVCVWQPLFALLSWPVKWDSSKNHIYLYSCWRRNLQNTHVFCMKCLEKWLSYSQHNSCARSSLLCSLWNPVIILRKKRNFESLL